MCWYVGIFRCAIQLYSQYPLGRRCHGHLQTVPTPTSKGSFNSFPIISSVPEGLPSGLSTEKHAHEQHPRTLQPFWSGEGEPLIDDMVLFGGSDIRFSCIQNHTNRLQERTMAPTSPRARVISCGGDRGGATSRRCSAWRNA